MAGLTRIFKFLAARARPRLGAGASELAVAGAVTVASSEGFELGRPGVARETSRDRDFRVG